MFKFKYWVWLIILIILVVFGAIVYLRFLAGDEDTWICVNGEWVKHGNPSAPKPLSGCGSGSEQVQTRSVNLYYYDLAKDKKENANNPSCKADYIVPVEREVPITNTPIQDTIKLLIEGKLTDFEKANGLTTEFPNKDFKLLGANLADGILTLDFTDVSGFTGGGSCRVGLLQAQIEKTARQFPEVQEVRYTKILFQP